MAEKKSPKPLDLDELIEKAEESIEVIPEVVEEKPKAVKSPKVHIVTEGETYASLGALYAPLGTRGYLHALYLSELNGNKVLAVGSEVKL